MFTKSLNTTFIGQNIIHLPTCQSTNTFAMELSDAEVEGTVIITSHQSAGKGQRGSSWESEANKNLTFSIILKPVFLPVAQQFNLSMTVSIALFEFLKKYLPENLKIKWINDIYFKDKKIAGILIENVIRKDFIEKSIIGIGININQFQFNLPHASSLALITSKVYDLEILLAEFLEIFEKQYLALQNNQSNFIKSYYIANLYRLGEETVFSDKEDVFFKGTIIGIDESGYLLVKTSNEVKKFALKEISFVI